MYLLFPCWVRSLIADGLSVRNAPLVVSSCEDGLSPSGGPGCTHHRVPRLSGAGSRRRGDPPGVRRRRPDERRRRIGASGNSDCRFRRGRDVFHRTTHRYRSVTASALRRAAVGRTGRHLARTGLGATGWPGLPGCRGRARTRSERSIKRSVGDISRPTHRAVCRRGRAVGFRPDTPDRDSRAPARRSIATGRSRFATHGDRGAPNGFPVFDPASDPTTGSDSERFPVRTSSHASTRGLSGGHGTLRHILGPAVSGW
jgi:hypothetical protein